MKKLRQDWLFYVVFVIGTLVLLPAWGLAQGGNAAKLAFFENRIRPVLIQHCYKCHSKQAKKLKGGLRLDLRATTLKGGETGPAVVPGNVKKSLLIQALQYKGLEMPPKGKLPAKVVADFVKWVKDGAIDPRSGGVRSTKRNVLANRDHWSFQPLKKAGPPSIKQRSWPITAADHFVLKKLEAKGLKPVSAADRYTWLRRVSFDLTGLPPTLNEIAGFQKDKSPKAFDRVVDRLLGSQAFGERWARHWLDLVGYADQLGTSNNVFAEHAWRYRNYVIDSYNDDKPFDRFIREQIAGDLIESKSIREKRQAITATGFLLLGDLEIVEADKAKLHVDIIDQQVNKVTTAFLALTVGCARCHDHKFDPIPQRDYYAIAGFFNSTESVFKTPRGVWSDVLASELPESKLAFKQRKKQAAGHKAKTNKLKDERKKAVRRKAELDKLIAKGGDAKTTKKLTDERNKLNGRIGQLKKLIEHRNFFAPTAPRAYAVKDSSKPTNMRITIRGNPRALGDEVPRGFLQVASEGLPRIPKGRSGRVQLADWIASANNPLTARVAVNRIWERLFGVGLVRSIDNFGIRGEKPTHPGLLDHLAGQFSRDGWSQKRLIRSLVLSRTYRMSSAHDDQSARLDPNNGLMWRMRRRRLDAESIRDALLAVSGKLKSNPVQGPAIPLEYPENVANIDPKNVNPPSFGLAKWRPSQQFERTVYLPILRSVPQPGPGELRNVFDFTQPAQFAGKRAVTAVPTQALFLMNSPVLKQHAKNLADRLARTGGSEIERLKTLWLLTLARPITKKEQIEASEFLKQVGKNAWREICHAIVVSNEFLMRL